jgi:uncharacterized membrane protein
MGGTPESSSNDQILEHLRTLEDRIARIESHLDLSPLSTEENVAPDSAQPIAAEDDEALELQLGQNWFAKAGIVGLALGIAFLLTLPYTGLPSFLPSVFGYAIVAGIFLLSRYWKESFEQVSRYLLGGGLLLLYFTTLRLSYFSPSPALSDTAVELTLLLLVVTVNIIVAVRRRSVYLAALNLSLGYLTALIGGQPYFVLAVVAILSAVSAYLSVRYRWTAILSFGIFLTYTTHLLWSANNPFFTNALEFGLAPQLHLSFILLYVVIFAVAGLLRGEDIPEHAPVIANSFLNGILGFGLFVLSTLAGPNISISGWHVVASALLLSISVLFWMREKSVYSTFVYAMLGYAALSIAIVAQSPMPDFFVWLCWQSILVVSTAVWFRSRFIVVANFVIYLIIFIAYLAMAATVSTVSVSFGVVALLSARILNWQKNRLVLRTELMRNAYLASALLFLPYALYHSVPARFVSVSWLVLALFYYLAGRIVKSRKYRWMALLTMSLTILYVFIVDLTTLDPVVRIVSFLVLGSVLLAVSMLYSRRKRKTAQ